MENMQLVDFLFIILLAILIGSVFTYGLKIKGPWGKLWTFFLVIFLGVWAAALWITPVGPTLLNVSWIPMLFTGILIALILAAITPLRKKDEPEVRKNTLGIFFWIFTLALVGAILVGMFYR